MRELQQAWDNRTLEVDDAVLAAAIEGIADALGEMLVPQDDDHVEWLYWCARQVASCNGVLISRLRDMGAISA